MNKPLKLIKFKIDFVLNTSYEKFNFMWHYAVKNDYRVYFGISPQSNDILLVYCTRSSILFARSDRIHFASEAEESTSINRGSLPPRAATAGSGVMKHAVIISFIYKRL